MAICSRCGRKHRRWRNKARTKPAGYCARCHRESMQAVRRSYLETMAVLISVLCPECQELIKQRLGGRRPVIPKMIHVDPTSHRRNR